jgi:hypothetical protein
MGDGMPPSTIVATSSVAMNAGSNDRRRRSDTSRPSMKRLSTSVLSELIRGEHKLLSLSDDPKMPGVRKAGSA